MFFPLMMILKVIFFGDRVHSLRYLGGTIKNVNNMPKFLVHFGFLFSNGV
jgi:hypothetical protein